MDLNSINTDTQADLANLSPQDQQQLRQFLMGEEQKAQIQGAVHSLTSVCFKKCITSKISSPGLDRNEETCMRNCVDRFMDSQTAVLTALQRMQGGR